MKFIVVSVIILSLKPTLAAESCYISAVNLGVDFKTIQDGNDFGGEAPAELIDHSLNWVSLEACLEHCCSIKKCTSLVYGAAHEPEPNCDLYSVPGMNSAVEIRNPKLVKQSGFHAIYAVGRNLPSPEVTSVPEDNEDETSRLKPLEYLANFAKSLASSLKLSQSPINMDQDNKPEGQGNNFVGNYSPVAKESDVGYIPSLSTLSKLALSGPQENNPAQALDSDTSPGDKDQDSFHVETSQQKLDPVSGVDAQDSYEKSFKFAWYPKSGDELDRVYRSLISESPTTENLDAFWRNVFVDTVTKSGMDTNDDPTDVSTNVGEPILTGSAVPNTEIAVGTTGNTITHITTSDTDSTDIFEQFQQNVATTIDTGKDKITGPEEYLKIEPENNDDFPDFTVNIENKSVTEPHSAADGNFIETEINEPADEKDKDDDDGVSSEDESLTQKISDKASQNNFETGTIEVENSSHGAWSQDDRWKSEEYSGMSEEISIDDEENEETHGSVEQVPVEDNEKITAGPIDVTSDTITGSINTMPVAREQNSPAAVKFPWLDQQIFNIPMEDSSDDEHDGSNGDAEVGPIENVYLIVKGAKPLFLFLTLSIVMLVLIIVLTATLCYSSARRAHYKQLLVNLADRYSYGKLSQGSDEDEDDEINAMFP